MDRMSNNMAEDAEYLRLALTVRLLTPAFAISWADAMIAQDESPTAPFIEVYICPEDDFHQIVHQLTILASSGDFQTTSTKALRRILGLLHERLADGQLTHGEVANFLDTLSRVARFVPEQEAAFLSWVDDEFELVACGIKDMNEAKDALEEFLGEYAFKALDD
jgi:hypothetical protein